MTISFSVENSQKGLDQPCEDLAQISGLEWSLASSVDDTCILFSIKTVRMIVAQRPHVGEL